MNPLEAMAAIGEVKKEAEIARRDFPAGMMLAGIASLILRELIGYALRKGPPPGLADDLKVTPEQAQKIREFVLRRELAREVE